LIINLIIKKKYNMKSKDAFKLLEEGVLRKGVKVKMSGLKGFDKFTEIDDVFVKRARPG